MVRKHFQKLIRHGKWLPESKIGMGFVAIVFIYSALIISQPLFTPVRDIYINRFTFGLPHWQWAMLQPTPSMYSMENTVELFREDPRQGNIRPIAKVKQIHHPTRFVFEPVRRFRLKLHRVPELWYRVSSTYQGGAASTLFHYNGKRFTRIEDVH